jgi:hypothetical protein
MDKEKDKKAGCKTLLVSLAGEGNIMRKKSSNQIVEELKSKGIHAEVCKRHKRQ